MNLKLKVRGAFAAAAIGALAFASIVAAQNATSTTSTPLGVSCTGSVVSSSITWSAVATGGTAPYHFAWTGDSNVAGATSPSVTANYIANGTYTARVAAMDSASSTATSTCSAAITIFGTSTSTTPTSTPPQPFVNQPILHIEGNGRFMARGMKVMSIASGSFQGQVWGVTYTINWNNNLSSSEFWFRFNRANGTSTPTLQLSVGDEVGVQGIVSAASPFVVNANVVRDYSITTHRPQKSDDENNGNGDGNGKGRGNENKWGNGAPGNSQDLQNKLQELLKQFQSLQGQLHGDTSNTNKGNRD